MTSVEHIRNAITLMFHRKFGAPEHDTDAGGGVILLVDKGLAGHIRTFKPALMGNTFTIGRAPGCTYRLGYDKDADDAARDEFGNVRFRHFSNIHATFKLIEDNWYIFPGGEYPGKNGKPSEWGCPGNGVYVNGHLLPGLQDPFPLFYRGDRWAKVQLGDAGKILIMRGVFGEQSTSIPEEMWTGEGWPDMRAIGKARSRAAAAARAIEPDTDHNQGIKPTSASWQTELIKAIERTPNSRLALYGVLGALCLAVILLVQGSALMPWVQWRNR